MEDRQKAVTVKIPRELYQTASDLTALTGVTFKELVAEALERELGERIQANDLDGAIKSMKAARARLEQTAP